MPTLRQNAKPHPTDADYSPANIREDVVEAAAKVFSRKGYHAASMQDIAQEAGMRKASLYHHVRKKEDLLYAIHEELIDGLIQNTITAIAESATPVEKLERILRAAMHLVADHNTEVKVFLHDVNALSGDRWQAIVTKRDIYERMVAGVLREGIAAGQFEDCNVQIATRGVLAMANWGYTWYRPDGPLSADEIADIFAHIALRGLLVRD